MSAWLALVAAVLTLALAHAGGGPPAVRLALAGAVLWVLPGHALAGLRGSRDPEPAAGLAYAFGGSAVWLALAAALCHALRLPPRAIADLTAALLALTGVLLLGRRATPAGAGIPPALAWAQALGLVALGGGLLYCGGQLGRSYDSLDHMAYLKSILRESQVLPLREYYREITSRVIDLRKGFLHAPMAETAALAGVSLEELWRAWPALAGPALTACFYVLARALVPSRAGAALAVLLFLAFYGGPGNAYLLKIGYPNKTADALVWLAWAGAAASLRRDAPGGPFPVPWLLAGAAMAAVFAPAPWFFTWTAFVVLAYLVPGARAHAPGALRLLLLSAACCAPILAWRFLVSYAPVNALHTQGGGMLLLPWGSVLDPQQLQRPLGVATWVSAAVSPFYLAHKPGPGRLLACACVWAGLGLLLNPALFPLVESRIGYLAVRLYAPAVALCVLGAWIADQAGELLRGRAAVRVRAVAWLAVLALLLVPGLKAGAQGYGPAAMAFEWEHSPGPWRATREFLDRAYPAPRVVLSDPMTSYALAGLTRHDVVATLNQHSSPSDSEAPERIRAALEAMSPACPPARTAAVLDRYGVELVVLNHTFLERSYDYLAAVNPLEYPRIEAKFGAHPELFREVFHAPGQWVYEVRHEALAAYAALPAAGWPVLEPPPGRAPIDLGSGTWLGAVALEPRVASLGESVWVDCLLRRDRVPRPMERLLAHVSLATRIALPRWLPSRLGRLEAQRRMQRVPRVNNWIPLSSLGSPPEYWPAGRWVRWRFPVYVPGFALPGTYVLRMRVMPEEFSPNVTPGYLLNDDDATPGGVLDSVVVRPRTEPGA